MARITSSQIEQHYFEQFRRDYLLPKGEVTYCDKPDVIVRGDSILGVEITNLFLAPGSNAASEQMQRGLREKVLQRAQAIFSEAGGKKFELSVDFNVLKPILQIEPNAQALYSVAQQLSNADSGTVSRALFEHIEPIRSIYLNANEYPDAKWRLMQGFSVPDLSVNRLREIVVEKSAKLPGYQACDQYWLLVVVDLIDSAQDQRLNWPSGLALGASPYEKVLIYKPQYREVVEIPQ
jgi:hypothetical protein